jgi:hypothetical protein
MKSFQKSFQSKLPKLVLVSDGKPAAAAAALEALTAAATANDDMKFITTNPSDGEVGGSAIQGGVGNERVEGT